MKIFRNQITRKVLIALVALVIFLAGTMVAGAGSLFDDVDDGAQYADAVEWLVNRAITLGCGGSNYCPNNRVTRAQMAMFMQRLGTALTPIHVHTYGGYASLDPDIDPVVCPTSGYATSNYPMQATVDFTVSIQGAGAMETIPLLDVSCQDL